MNTQHRLPIAITCGDPAGIGPAVIDRYLREHPHKQHDLCVIGPRQWLDSLPRVNTVAVGDQGFCPHPGTPTIEGAAIAAEALEEAALGCRQGRYRSVVTAPVSKEWMNRAGWAYPGQTEYFAERWFGKPSMAFAGGRLRVVLATWHIPLSEVAARLTYDTIEHAVRNAAFLASRLQRAQSRKSTASRQNASDKHTPPEQNAAAAHSTTALHSTTAPHSTTTAAASDSTDNNDTAADQTAAPRSNEHPRIAVCGLNPHAGEGGLLGFEEQGIIDPVLDTLRTEFPGLSRCLPGDTVFWRHLQGEFDIVVAMYHDQGLAPLKTLEFDQSVNISLGLPFIRTSPDHGTAFALAARQNPDISIASFARAVELADELTYGV